MSTYYNINGLKVRVSDHEPNTALRGGNDIYFWTKSADNSKLSVISQIEAYCEKHDMDINLFAEIMRDFPDPIKYENPTKKIEITSEFYALYSSFTGKGSMKKQERLCKENNIPFYQMSQGYYVVK